MYLFLNSASSDSITVKVFEANKILDSRSAEGGRKLSEKMLALIDEVVSTCGSMGDLQGVAVVSGPGPFTSLRLSAVIANTLSSQLSIPLASLPLSELDSDDKLLASISTMKKENIAEPKYDRDPNITMPTR